MPSCSSKPQATQQNVVIVDLLQEPVKSSISVADKKLRNLEKRRLKLVELQKKAEKGEKLNDDQKLALKSLESVDYGLEAVRDVQKLLTALEQDYSKLLKKEQKRIKQEQKDALENRNLKCVSDIIDFQAILGEMSDDVRPDFLAGSNGACQLTETEIESLDTVYECINPASEEDEKKTKLSERAKTASLHLVSLVEGKNSPIVEGGVTFKEVQETLIKIKESGYFDKESNSDETIPTETSAEEQKPEDVPAAEESPEQQQQQQVEEPAVTKPVNGVDLPPEVQTTQEEEGFNFMGESEISSSVQEASLNPVSPEFVPRKMQPPQSGFDNGDNDGNEADWQQSGHNNHGNYKGGRGRGRGRGRGSYRGGNRGGNASGSGNYRGENREYRGSRGGGNREGGRGGSNYRGGNRDGNRDSNRSNNYRGGNRGNYRGGQGDQQQNQTQQQQQ